MVLANVAYKEQLTRLFGCLSQKYKRLCCLPPRNPQPNHNTLNIYSFNTQKCVMKRTAISDVLDGTGKFKLAAEIIWMRIKF